MSFAKWWEALILPILLLIFAFFGVALPGCAFPKASDVTPIGVQAFDRGEGTGGVLPQEWTGLPGALVFPYVPGKDVDGELIETDPQTGIQTRKFTISTSESVVATAKFAGLEGLNAQLLAFDQMNLDRLERFEARLINYIDRVLQLPIVQAQMNRGVASLEREPEPAQNRLETIKGYLDDPILGPAIIGLLQSQGFKIEFPANTATRIPTPPGG